MVKEIVEENIGVKALENLDPCTPGAQKIWTHL
jgi:hypothetical protein